MAASVRTQQGSASFIGAVLRSGGLAALVGLVTLVPVEATAQGRGHSRDGEGWMAADGRREAHYPSGRAESRRILSTDLQSLIRQYYSSRPSSQLASLPPGIRRNLARGKPLPPGIAKRYAPANLSQRLRVPQGYQLMEMGRDVLLVEVATNLIQDILFDVIR